MVPRPEPNTWILYHDILEVWKFCIHNIPEIVHATPA